MNWWDNIFGSSGNSNTGGWNMPSQSNTQYMPMNGNVDFSNIGTGGYGNLDPNQFMRGGELSTSAIPNSKNSSGGGSSDLAGIAQLIQGLSGLYTGFVGNQQARRSLNFTKDAFNRQNAQQVKTYNNYLEDRARSRFGIEGKSQAEADAFIKKQSL